MLRACTLDGSHGPGCTRCGTCDPPGMPHEGGRGSASRAEHKYHNPPAFARALSSLTGSLRSA